MSADSAGRFVKVVFMEYGELELDFAAPLTSEKLREKVETTTFEGYAGDVSFGIKFNGDGTGYFFTSSYEYNESLGRYAPVLTEFATFTYSWNDDDSISLAGFTNPISFTNSYGESYTLSISNTITCEKVFGENLYLDVTIDEEVHNGVFSVMEM